MTEGNNTPARRAMVHARREEAWKLHNEGWTNAAISERQGVGESTTNVDIQYMKALAQQISGRQAEAEVKRVIKLLIDAAPAISITSNRRAAAIPRIDVDSVDFAKLDLDVDQLRQVFRAWRTFLTAINQRLENQ